MHPEATITTDPACDRELAELGRHAPAEAEAIRTAVSKLRAEGHRLGYPHSSSIRGARGLRELRPRAGRSPWRLLYARGGAGLVLLAVAPEAMRDPRGFRAAVDRARRRRDHLDQQEQ